MGSDDRPIAAFRAETISIHAPRMGSDHSRMYARLVVSVISIHAPRMGSDFRFFDFFPNHGISIHAPRMGSDKSTR